jgi:hypothetical protein
MRIFRGGRLKVGKKIVHNGTTKELERTEKEHQQKCVLQRGGGLT